MQGIVREYKCISVSMDKDLAFIWVEGCESSAVLWRQCENLFTSTTKQRQTIYEKLYLGNRPFT